MRRHSRTIIFTAALLLASISAGRAASAPPAATDSQSDLSKIIDETTKSTVDNPAPAQPPVEPPPADASTQPVPIPVNPSQTPPDVTDMADEMAAADGKTLAVVEYGPDDCDFRINLPGTPDTMQRCENDDPEKCHLLTTYTHVFELAATVTFTVSCNTADKNAYDHYSGDVMRAALARLSKDRLEKFETAYQHYDVAKESSVLGAIKTGGSEGIYVAQLWISHNSIFTVEGEMLGADRDDATKMFIDVLRTIRHKDWPLNEKGAVVIPKSAVIVDAPTPPASEKPAAGTPSGKTPDKSPDKAPDIKKDANTPGSDKKKSP
jgi:hypothetical protein